MQYYALPLKNSRMCCKRCRRTAIFLMIHFLGRLPLRTKNSNPEKNLLYDYQYMSFAGFAGETEI